MTSAPVARGRKQAASARAGQSARKTAPRPASRPRASTAPRASRQPNPSRDTAPPSGEAPRTRSATASAAGSPAPRPCDPFGADDLGRPGEEETIESSKYVARAPRRFEQERFVFPQSYAVNKVRLLMRDPQWLFAHWEVDPGVFDELRHVLGERMVALSRLTLRVHDAVSGGASVVLLPFGARAWYVHADAARRSYRAELGVTLPSGEFRLLARSNTVTMPRHAPSRERASRRVRYALHAEPAVVASESASAERAALAEPGPWQAPAPHEARTASGAAALGGARGGASDVHRPPAPGAARGGASDVFRR